MTAHARPRGPHTIVDWSTWVLVIAVVIVLAVAFYLARQVSDLQGFVQESREQRTTYQRDDTTRGCLTLTLAGATPAQLATVDCPPADGTR